MLDGSDQKIAFVGVLERSALSAQGALEKLHLRLVLQNANRPSQFPSE